MSSEPIKRSKALLPLSREHHVDLLLVWKVRKGLNNNTASDRIAAYIKYLDENLMAAHFHDEEILLFDQLPADDPLCKRAKEEHQQIRGMIHEICEQRDDPWLFNRFSDAVERHVRYEERELFPYLEDQLSARKLAEIEKFIAEKHHPFHEVWSDEFWH